MRPPKISLLGLLLPGLVVIATACGGPSQTNAVQEVPVAVHIPTSAEVARQIGCGRYKDTGTSHAAGVVTSGFCFIGEVKYAIDTFPSMHARDIWLSMTEAFGLDMKWKTSTAIVYVSIHQPKKSS